MKRAKPTALVRAGLVVCLSLAATETGAQDDERTLADEIPDVEIPDVLIGQNDAVVREEPEPPPVAVFEAPLPQETQLEESEALPEIEGEVVTGNISAIDLEDGTLEVDTDTQGTLRLSADRALLRQISPGQSVSLSYVDRDDGRWVAELEALDQG